MTRAAEPQEGLRDIGREIAQDAARLVRAEIELARTQATAAAKRFLIAAVLAMVAALLLFIALIEAIGAIPSEFGPDLFHNRWLGWLAVGVLIALLAGLFGVLAFRRFRKAITSGKETVGALKEDSEWLKQLSRRRNNGS